MTPHPQGSAGQGGADELLPCPFCGNDAKSIYDGPSDIQVRTAHSYGEDVPRGYWRVQCCKCGTSVGETRKQQEAVAMWQTRSNTALEQAQRELAKVQAQADKDRDDKFAAYRIAEAAEARAAEMQETCAGAMQEIRSIALRPYVGNDRLAESVRNLNHIAEKTRITIDALPSASGNYAKLLQAAQLRKECQRALENGAKTHAATFEMRRLQRAVYNADAMFDEVLSLFPTPASKS